MRIMGRHGEEAFAKELSSHLGNLESQKRSKNKNKKLQLWILVGFDEIM
jgi:hypothetical protein